MSGNPGIDNYNGVKMNYTDLRNISDSLNVKTAQPKSPGNGSIPANQKRK